LRDRGWFCQLGTIDFDYLKSFYDFGRLIENSNFLRVFAVNSRDSFAGQVAASVKSLGRLF